MAIGVSITALVLVVACDGSSTQVTSPTPTDQAVPTQKPFSTAVSQLASSPTPDPSQSPLPTSPNEPSPSPKLPELTLEKVFQGVPFTRLTNFVQAGERFFVTEQIGRVIALRNGSDSTGVAVFLDIQDRVSTAGNEEGLLGLAFDPRFESNGHFYVYYSAAAPGGR